MIVSYSTYAQNSTFPTDGSNVRIGTVGPTDMLDVKLAISGSTGGITLRDTYPFARLYDAMGGPDAGTLDLLYQNATNVKLSSNGDSYFNGGNIAIVKIQTKKIEELTLYLIEKERQIKIEEAQQISDQKLQEQLKTMQDQLSKLMNQKANL